MKPVVVLRHEPSVSMGSLAGLLDASGLATRQIDLFESTPARLPWDDLAGLVVLGGSMSANDTVAHPFLAAELDWIREAVDRRTPLLGICLGAQLLAKALGARVYPNRDKEIGWRRIELLKAASSDRLFGGRGDSETVFQWHGDTFDLPPGAVHLARGESCANQAFRVGPRAYGVQFHVEMTPTLMEEWLADPGFAEELSRSRVADPAAIRREAPSRFLAMQSLSHGLMGRFAELCVSPT